MRTRNFDTCESYTPDGVKVVAKHARTVSDKALRSLRNEYVALREISRVASGLPERSFPKPILFQEDDRVLLMSALPGVALSRCLKWRANTITGWYFKPWLEQVGCNTGRWLRKFHSLTLPDYIPHNHHAYIKGVEENVARCTALGISETVLVRTFAWAEELSHSLHGNSVSTAASHGDFLPQNLLVCGTEIAVIDFASYHSSAPIYLDLAAFLSYIIVLRQKTKYSGDALEKLAKSFVAGYGADYCEPMLRLYMLNAVFRMVRDHDFDAIAPHFPRYIEGALTQVVEGACPIEERVSVST